MTMVKSRSKARPALLQNGQPIIWRICSFLAPVCYVFAVLVLFVTVIFRFVPGMYEGRTQASSEWIIPAAEAKSAQTDSKETVSLPVRLMIPKIRVNAVIKHVGLLADGSMGIPKLPSETVWYKSGSKPGAIGSAVIAGHVNWWYGAKGVFENLKKLKKGDVITVQDNRGVTTSFAVRTIRTIGQKEDASDVFRSYDGKSHLNLVTCSGVWNKATQAYSKRIVVFTDKIIK
jgi:LPXTG-site transpeptidase (sortase) family protein